MRKGFTLIELMAVVAIIAMMVAGGLAASVSNRESARLKGAVRAVYATLRQARVTALVTCKPCEITYSTRRGRGDMKIKSAIDDADDGKRRPRTLATISGEEIFVGEDGEGGKGGSSRSLREIFSPSLPEELMDGISLKVVKKDEFEEEGISEENRKSMLSVFSNVDYLLGRKTGAGDSGEEKTDEKDGESPGASDAAAADAGGDLPEETSIMWEANGKCEPHEVWVYPTGAKKERGFCISVDGSGVAKILDGGEDGR